MPRLNRKKFLDLMFQRSLNLRDVAKACNVGTASLSALANGKRTVANIPTVSKLANFFGVSPFELLDDADNPKGEN